MPESDRPYLAVILAAGGGRRIGGPKGLLRLAGRPLVLHHAEALAPFADRVAIAIGAQAAAHRAVLAGYAVVENPRWRRTWPADSLRCVLRALPGEGACWVQPVDTPPATADTLQALLRAGAPAVPVDPRGRPGHPVLLDAAAMARVRARAPTGGLRTLLRDAARVPVAQRTVALDFDRPADWARFCADGDG